MRIFERLRDDHGYFCGYDSVRRFVKQHRTQHRETFIPLDHDPGQRLEADFDHIYVDFPDGRRQVPVLILVWSYSNAPFTVALPSCDSPNTSASSSRNPKKKPVTGLADGVAEKLLNYSWPGNVRELRNVMERAVALTRYDKTTVEDLPEKVRNFIGGAIFIGGLDPAELVSMEEIEKRYINHVLDACGGNQTQAARILGLDRKTIYRKMKSQ